MTYDQIKTKLLRQNSLLDTARFLKASGGEVYTADRHMLHSDRETFKGLDLPVRDLGILLGLDLLRDWARATEEIRWLFISKPCLTVGGAWCIRVRNGRIP